MQAAASCPSHIISSADPLAVEVPASLAKAARGKKGKNKGNSDGKTEEKPKGKAKEKTAEQEAEEKAASIAEGVLKRLGQSTHIAGAGMGMAVLQAHWPYAKAPNSAASQWYCCSFSFH